LHKKTGAYAPVFLITNYYYHLSPQKCQSPFQQTTTSLSPVRVIRGKFLRSLCEKKAARWAAFFLLGKGVSHFWKGVSHPSNKSKKNRGLRPCFFNHKLLLSTLIQSAELPAL
jgi:hypothetical protein